MDEASRHLAMQILKKDTEKIYDLIESQKEHLCFAACPAFEEVVDTQLFGLSRQIEFAIAIGLLENNEGQRMLSDLETSLNEMYTSYYETMNKTALEEEF